MSSTVYVVEDEKDIADLIAHNLHAAGYHARVFHAGQPALKAAEATPPALFLLDIMLPQGSGLDLCRWIRGNPNLNASRVIFVTANSSETDRVVGLELGADDYIVKPFSPRELVARVRAVLRRGVSGTQENVICVGDLKIDVGAMTISLAGASIETTTTEFRILEALARSAGRVVSRERLIDLVWGNDRIVESRSVDVYISRLREKLESNSKECHYLKTIRGIGYRMDVHNRSDGEVA